MFDDNFSFATPRSASIDSLTTSTRDSSRSVSPCTSTAPLLPAQFSVADLATQFAGQRIRREAQMCYDSCKAYANGDNDASWAIPPLEECESASLQRARTFPTRLPSASTRAQRQLSTQLLCTTTHRRDIAALVAGMIVAEDQCCITPSEPSHTPLEDDDEGYNSSDDTMTETSRRSSFAVMPRPEHRRASDLISGGACVNKSIRIRRDRNHRRIRSSEASS